MAVESNGRLVEPGQNGSNGSVVPLRSKAAKKQKGGFSIISIISRYAIFIFSVLAETNTLQDFLHGTLLSQFSFDVLQQSISSQTPHQRFANHTSK
jgi:hypothetical protein